MPIIFTRSAPLRLRTVTCYGVIDDVTLLRAYRNASAQHSAQLDDVIDLTGVTSVLLSERALPDMTRLLACTGTCAARLALVAPHPHTEPVARLFQQLHTRAEVRRCTSVADALTWLRQPPG